MRAGFAAGTAYLPVWRVKHLHEGQREIPLDQKVHAAPVILGRVLSRNPLAGFVELVHQALIDRHHDARTAGLGIQLARDGKNGVADLLRLQPPAIESPQ